MNRLIRLVLMGAFAASSIWAQATAQIHGAVQDMSGAAVPGASVKATQLDTGVSRTVTSEADGGYVLPNLPIGPYTMEITKDGFTTAVQTGIVLQVNSDPAIPIALRIGAVSERVNVEANATQVETRSAGVGTVIENQRIIDLPLNGRQPTDLITLSGAAVQTRSSPGYSMNTGVSISVAGGTDFGVQYNLDGAGHINVLDGGGMPLPFPDALQEFRVVTSTQDAANGGRPGAAVNGVTKSGTNALHGDAFWFVRNAYFNARDFFAASNDKLKRNQFGGVLGGALKKDKLFYFMGYQGTKTRQTPSDTLAFVPTTAMLNGDFTQFASAACQGTARTLLAPFGTGGFAANTTSPANLSPAAIKIAARLPKTNDPCGRVLTGNILSENQMQVPIRVDYQMSEKQTIFARYIATRIDTVNPFFLSPDNLLTTSGVGADDFGQSLSFGDTYLISPSTVNSFRVYGNRIGFEKVGAKFFGPQDVGINAYSEVDKFMTVRVTGGPLLGASNFTANSLGHINTYGFADDVSLVRGSHQFTFGGDLSRAQVHTVSNAFSVGSYTMSGQVTGLGMGDFLTGNVFQLRQASANPLNLTQTFLGLYAQDAWKATSRLTITYGARWNPFLPMSFRHGDIYNFSQAGFLAGKRSTAIPNAPPGFTYPGDPGFNGNSGMERRLGYVSPRIGISFDPFGDGKTAIRVGAGYSYDFMRMDLHQSTSSVSPFRATVIRQGVNLDNPWAGFPGGNPFPYSFNRSNPVFQPSGSYLPVPANMKTTKQYTWNVGIQRQMTPTWFFSATYVGTKLDHVWNAVELNPAQLLPGVPSFGATNAGNAAQCAALLANCPTNVEQRRLLRLANPIDGEKLGFVTQYDDGGTQSYNGLLISSNIRMGQNINLSGNYTWSHCIGLPFITLLNPGQNYVHQAFQNNGPVNRNLDVGNCAQDRRHIANITLVARTPKFSGVVARWLASGWTASTILTMRAGQPLNVVTGANNSLNGFFGNSGTERPNQVLTETAATDQGSSCAVANCVSWLNPAAFAAPAPGTYGNMGAFNLVGPGYWDWSQAISREFRLTESQRFEFRAEAFNVTNSVRFNNPGLTTGQGNTFGRITSSAAGLNGNTGGGPRVMQFALKYVF